MGDRLCLPCEVWCCTVLRLSDIVSLGKNVSPSETMARVRGATRGEILRAAQKDATYLEEVQSKVSSLVVNLWGPTLWAQWQRWLGPATSCLYYSLTALRCCQTLGEEYTEVVQV